MSYSDTPELKELSGWIDFKWFCPRCDKWQKAQISAAQFAEGEIEVCCQNRLCSPKIIAYSTLYISVELICNYKGVTDIPLLPGKETKQ